MDVALKMNRPVRFANRLDPLRLLPVRQPQQHRIESLLIAREQAARIQQLLKNLVVGSELDLALKLKFFEPITQCFGNRLGGKSRRNSDGLTLRRIRMRQGLRSQRRSDLKILQLILW